MDLIDALGSGGLCEVGCGLTFEVTEAALFAIQVAPSTTAGVVLDERVEITNDPMSAPASVVEIVADHGGRVHLVSVPPGVMSFAYAAELQTHRGTPSAPNDDFVASMDAVVALRQSRYCPSDVLAGYATTEFFDVLGDGPDAIALRVASWVFERCAYSAGSSGPLDTALDTLLSGAGVCRDFAHLTIALCRALGVPARLAAVYAPGLALMDFHAVVEILAHDGWWVLDPTRLAPRGAMVRIATGRDAADTAFATTLRGAAELVASSVFASSNGDLPGDDHAHLFPLA